MSDPDRRIFEYFRSDENTANEVDYLAYASYAFAKFEWFDKFTDENNVEPSQGEIERWVQELPDSRLDEIHIQASRVFRSAAREFMKPEVERAKSRAVEESILAEVKRSNENVERVVKSATSFIKNLLPNIGVGILSSVIFAIVLILASLIFAKDPSPLALYKEAIPTSPAPEGQQPSRIPSPARP